MPLTIEEIAWAFSSHNFDSVYDYLAENVVWNVVGEPPLLGRDEVMSECEQSTAYLAGVATEFRRQRSVVGETRVAIDSLADYTDADGTRSTVASCDVYEFSDSTLVEITSYNIEIADS